MGLACHHSVVLRESCIAVQDKGSGVGNAINLTTGLDEKVEGVATSKLSM